MAEHFTRRYHSGKFCPFSKTGCRSDCASLRSSDFCMLIDGSFSLSQRIEDMLADFVSAYAVDE